MQRVSIIINRRELVVVDGVGPPLRSELDVRERRPRALKVGPASSPQFVVRAGEYRVIDEGLRGVDQ